MKKDDSCPDPPGRETSPDRPAISWESASVLFAMALEFPVEKRLQWLAGLTGIDEELRREVASLLLANEEAGDFLNPEKKEGGSS